MSNRTCFKKYLTLSLFLLLSACFLPSCTNLLPDAHRQDIVQGNEIKREALNKVHVGMSKSQVTSIIGNPTLKDPFHANRWDYIYRFVAGREQARQSNLILFFEGDKLVRIDDSGYQEPESLIEKKD